MQGGNFEGGRVVLSLDDKKDEKYQDTVRSAMVDLIGRRLKYCMEYLLLVLKVGTIMYLTIP